MLRRVEADDPGICSKRAETLHPSREGWLAVHWNALTPSTGPNATLKCSANFADVEALAHRVGSLLLVNTRILPGSKESPSSIFLPAEAPALLRHARG